MNKQVRQLQRTLEHGPGKGQPALTRYCYNAMSWQLQSLLQRAHDELYCLQEEITLITRLRDEATRRSYALLAAEQTHRQEEEAPPCS